MLLAEAANFVDGRFSCFTDASGFDVTADGTHRQVLAPPVRGDPTVTPAGTRTATIALDDNDGFFRVRLLQADGRPKAKEAAADNADIRLNCILQSRGQIAVQVECLGIPESTVHSECL
ncbi:hypothetical protein D3C79_912430 [compost metagenome]